jgi:drug/metabolite transporter (DMT)-like permease
MMWAFQFSGAKIATERLGPTTVTFVTMVLATVLLLPLLVRERHKGSPGLASNRRVLRDVCLLALLGCTPAQICLTWGVRYSLASNGAVLTLTIPVLTAVLAALLLGERMTLLRWISFVMAIAGALTVSDIDWSSVDLVGNLLILGSCLGSAFCNSFSKRVLETLSPVALLVYSFAFADIILLVLVLIIEPTSLSHLGSLDAATWGNLLGIAIFSLALSMVLFFWVIRWIEVTQASLSIYLLPVFGVLISALMLHERVTAQLVLGGLLVFGGTLVATVVEDRLKSRQGTVAPL